MGTSKRRRKRRRERSTSDMEGRISEVSASTFRKAAASDLFREACQAWASAGDYSNRATTRSSGEA
jgi:hypothetical protein